MFNAKIYNRYKRMIEFVENSQSFNLEDFADINTFLYQQLKHHINDNAFIVKENDETCVFNVVEDKFDNSSKITNFSTDVFNITEKYKNKFYQLLKKNKFYEISLKQNLENSILAIAENNEDLTESLNIFFLEEINKFKSIAKQKLVSKKKIKNDKIKADKGNLFIEQDIFNISHLSCIHVTNYLPKTNKDGSYAIETLAKATKYELPRTSVHTAISHIVESNDGGSWDDMKYVIVSPLEDTITLNKKPTQFSLIDTWWSLDPQEGLVLPHTHRVVMPAPLKEGLLYCVTDNKTLYKSENYSKQEQDTIISSFDRNELTKFKSIHDPKAIEKMLYLQVRKMATKATLDDMGLFYLEGNKLSNDKEKERFKNTGLYFGMNVAETQYGHSNSDYAKFEEPRCQISASISLLSELLSSKNKLKKISKSEYYELQCAEGNVTHKLSKEAIISAFAVNESLKNLKTNTSDKNLILADKKWREYITSTLSKIKIPENVDTFIQNKITKDNHNFNLEPKNKSFGIGIRR